MHTSSNNAEKPVLITLASDLGWMALVLCDDVLGQLVFGYRSAAGAIRTLDSDLVDRAAVGPADHDLVHRLQAYAGGEPVDFRDVRVDTRRLGMFQRQVVRHCRRIAYGKTLTYGQLAARAGSPGAARAVGNCMAANRVPLIVPCHRVIASDGRIGGFSAPGGASTKGRLLAMEARR